MTGIGLLVAALIAGGLSLSGILPPAGGLRLLAVLAWFAMPGVVLARCLYGGWRAAVLAGPAWGYVLSSLALLALWSAGVRDFRWLLCAPIPGMLAAWPFRRLRSILAPPVLTHRDTAAVAVVVLAALAIVGRPYARVGEDSPDGRAYRAYFTADFIWAMAVVSEVSKGDVPPRNPYYLDDELHYYWLMHLLPAAEYRAGAGGASLEQVLLVNALGSAIVFAGFFYFFVRHFVDSAWAAAAACVFVLLCSSFEGVDRLWNIWQRGASYEELRYLNIDAVGSWVYQGMKVDGLHRLLLYQPQHQVGYVLGFSALLLIAQTRDVSRPLLMMLAGFFLGSALLFSSFAAGMLAIATALYAGFRLLLAGQWRAMVTGALAGAAFPVAALGLGYLLRYVDTASAGNPLVILGANRLAFRGVAWALWLNFGPVLMVAATGVFAALALKRLGRFVPVWWVLLVCALFYFYVDVPDHQNVYVAWRAAHLAFVALAPLCAFALQALWQRAGVVRWGSVAAAVLVAMAALPTVAIDIFNSQDLDNRAQGPGFRWTVILSPPEVEALEWIRGHTRPTARVQVEPVVRDRDTWAYIPAFGDRRMSAGLPIGMIPLAKYEEASARIKAMYSAPTAAAAHADALAQCVDYLVIGAPERTAYPHLQPMVDATPYLFTPAFRNDEVAIFVVRGPHPGHCSA